MKNMIKIAGILLFLTNCQSSNLSQNPTSLNNQKLGYVLSGDNEGSNFAHNKLTIFEQETFKKTHEISLPKSGASKFGIDGKKRIWIGFSGNYQKNDNRVNIYSQQGELIKQITPCEVPKSGFTFTKTRAFISCNENGFFGKIAVVNLESLAIEKTIQLQVKNKKSYLLTTIAGNEQNIIISGLTDGAKETSYSVVTVINAQTLQIKHQIELGENTDIWDIIPEKNNFYLLNVGSWRSSRKTANDILVLNLDKQVKITPFIVDVSPLWGKISGDYLYSYHNPTWNQPNSDRQRKISQFNLKTKEVKIWSLDDEWNANDLTIMNGKILLTRWLGDSGNLDGLYEFDLKNGKITKQLLQVKDANRLLIAH